MKHFLKIIGYTTMGIAIGIVFMAIWFEVGFLREFLIGEDSPTSLGFPLGFITGLFLYRSISGSPKTQASLLISGILTSLYSYFRFTDSMELAREIEGWNGLVHVVSYYSWVIIFIGTLCVCLSAATSIFLAKQTTPN